jgi:hypothetical protein
MIGPLKTLIQTDTGAYGSTSLTEVGNEYFLYNNGGTGPALTTVGAPLTVGQIGAWAPIGAVQTASGYEVAVQYGTANEYTIWTVSSSGAILADAGVLAGNSLAFEMQELTFNQDLNGDGVTGIYAAPGTTLQLAAAVSAASHAATIGAGATLDVAGSTSASITFNAATGMLKLDNPSSFSGEISNFRGDGTLSGSDQIDLTNINYNSVHDSYANGVLTVSDGTTTDALNFSGSYVLANFSFASDGKGGTIVYDPPVPQNVTSDAVALPVSDPVGGQTPAAMSDSQPLNVTGTVEVVQPSSANFAFQNASQGDLILDQPSTFAGSISGFGDRSIIDLPGIAFGPSTTLGYLPNGNHTQGTLSLTDGSHSANIALLGNYMASSFAVMGDNHGGSMVIAEASQSANQSLLTNPHHP